jgi:hypothetical protein
MFPRSRTPLQLGDPATPSKQPVFPLPRTNRVQLARSALAASLTRFYAINRGVPASFEALRVVLNPLVLELESISGICRESGDVNVTISELKQSVDCSRIYLRHDIRLKEPEASPRFKLQPAAQTSFLARIRSQHSLLCVRYCYGVLLSTSWPRVFI